MDRSVLDAVGQAMVAVEASGRRYGPRSVEAVLAARALEHWQGVMEDDAKLAARSLPEGSA
jgi:hypothetical protein